MPQKGQTQVLILAGIVILIAVAGGVFFLGRITLPRQDSSGQAAPKPEAQNVATTSPQPSPTPAPTTFQDPTANWKTYKYTTFSVRLSDRWTQEKPWEKIPSLIEGITFSTKDDPYNISFQVTNDPYPLEESSRGHSKVEYITLDEQPAVKFVVIAGQAGDIYQPTVQSNYSGNRFTIFISAKSNEAQTDKEFNQILSTFRFLD